mmetsp:Transcript_38225/g.101495  ORF Transcript_38225/g.101495 Transcript_38225/m.101495 type:complete len:116 (-) Transcript_38225:357-704(-)
MPRCQLNENTELDEHTPSNMEIYPPRLMSRKFGPFFTSALSMFAACLCRYHSSWKAQVLDKEWRHHHSLCLSAPATCNLLFAMALIGSGPVKCINGKERTTQSHLSPNYSFPHKN